MKTRQEIIDAQKLAYYDNPPDNLLGPIQLGVLYERIDRLHKNLKEIRSIVDSANTEDGIKLTPLDFFDIMELTDYWPEIES